MPTVLRDGGFRFFIFPGDHAPPHVHAFNADGVAVIEIETLHVRRVDGSMRPPDVSRAAAIVADHQDALLKRWREIHAS